MEVVRVAVCDDDREYVEMIIKYVSIEMEKYERRYDVERFTSGK